MVVDDQDLEASLSGRGRERVEADSVGQGPGSGLVRVYQRVIDLVNSPSNGLELCVGTLAEMTEGDIYEAVENYSSQEKIAYIHLRNVRGKVPYYTETFIDDGDIDVSRILTILYRTGFEGVVIPDHAPQMTCSAPWHAGMAHTLGFIAGVKAMLDVSALTERPPISVTQNKSGARANLASPAPHRGS